MIISRDNKEYWGRNGWGSKEEAIIYSDVGEAQAEIDRLDPDMIQNLHIRKKEEIGKHQFRITLIGDSAWRQKRICAAGVFATENNRARLSVRKVLDNCRLAYFHIHGRAGSLKEVQAFVVELLAAEPEAERARKNQSMEKSVWEPSHINEMQRRQKSPMPLTQAIKSQHSGSE